MSTASRDSPGPGPSAASQTQAQAQDGSSKTKKRVRNFTADDRAAHRAFERGRREAFKERLIELASMLPALADTEPQRLSKHVVVEESIAHQKTLQASCIDALQRIRSLIEERDELLTEVNNWRSSAGVSPRQPKQADWDGAGMAAMEAHAQHQPSLALSVSPQDDVWDLGMDPMAAQINEIPTEEPEPQAALPVADMPPSMPMMLGAQDPLTLGSSWPPPVNHSNLPPQASDQAHVNPLVNNGVGQQDAVATNSMIPQSTTVPPQFFDAMGDDLMDSAHSILPPGPTEGPFAIDPINIYMPLEHSVSAGATHSMIPSQNQPWTMWQR